MLHVLPPEALRVLRPEGERLTLLDVEISGEPARLVLRRSTIDEEDWWAYTPEHRADVEAALNEENGGIRMTLPELERFARDRGR